MRSGKKKAARLETMQSEGRLTGSVGRLKEQRAQRWARSGVSSGIGQLRLGENEWATDLGRKGI